MIVDIVWLWCIISLIPVFFIDMARQISQETFDAAVLENIELLEMSPDDAVLEAVQQFEAQVR